MPITLGHGDSQQPLADVKLENRVTQVRELPGVYAIRIVCESQVDSTP
jgi:hypothetical protein